MTKRKNESLASLKELRAALPADPGTGLKLLGSGAAAAASLSAAYLFSLRCRSGQEGLEELRTVRYAHRGLHQPGIPENSLAAFRKALEKGYGCELDVHLMKDGRLAVVHDSDLTRMTGRTVRIEDLTAEELADYPLTGTEERIPLFEEVLELFAGRTPLIVELKVENGNYNALAEAAVTVLDRFPTVRYCIESFDFRALIWLRKHRPEIIRGQLSTDLTRTAKGQQNPAGLFIVEHLLSNCLSRPDFIAYEYTQRRRASVELCQELYHVQEASWTVRSEADAAALEKLGNLIIFENFGW